MEVVKQIDEEMGAIHAQTDQMNLDTFAFMSARFKSFCESLVGLFYFLIFK